MGDGRFWCEGCRVSVTAGTIFHRTRTPLTVWFAVAWYMTSAKSGVSAKTLHRLLGFGSYETAWTMLHRFRTAMVRPGRDRLGREVEVDETSIGGVKPGKRARGAAGKTLVAVAVERRRPKGFGRCRLRVIPHAEAPTLRVFLLDSVEPGLPANLRRLIAWPQGFGCPRCGGTRAWPVRQRWWQCAGCAHQTSVTAGTIFQDTRTPLLTWFRAMWWVTEQKTGVSALGLQRALGLGSYKTAWTWLHKLRRAMVRPGRDRLAGPVEVDETHWGAAEAGGWGRRKLNNVLIAVAVELRSARAGWAASGCARSPTPRPTVCRRSSQTRSPPGAPREPGPHGWLAGLRAARAVRVWAPHHVRQGPARVGLGVVAASPSRGVALEALAPRDASRWRELRAPRLLPRRVHLPVQSALVTLARQALLSARAAGRRSGASPVQKPDRPRPQHVGVT